MLYFLCKVSHFCAKLSNRYCLMFQITFIFKTDLSYIFSIALLMFATISPIVYMFRHY